MIRLELTGNTYGIKEILKGLGFSWNGKKKCWYKCFEDGEESYANELSQRWASESIYPKIIKEGVMRDINTCGDINACVDKILSGADILESLSLCKEDVDNDLVGVIKGKTPEEVGKFIKKKTGKKVQFLGMDMATWNDVFTELYPEILDRFNEEEDDWDEFIEDYYKFRIINFPAGDLLYVRREQDRNYPFGIEVKVVNPEVSYKEMEKELLKKKDTVMLVVEQDGIVYVICGY